MPSFGRAVGIALCVSALGIALGCHSIVGIEDRTVDACDEHCQACERYCEKVMANCTGTNEVYQTHEACLGICAELPLGDFIEPGNTNTIACRENQADRALTTGEPREHCKAAGPGGANVCGTDCDAYCYLFPRVCGDQGLASESDCEASCEALPNSGEFSTDLAYDAANVECRLIHLSNATLDEVHCGHAKFLSTLHCMRVPNQDPDCELMCTVAMGACRDELAVYDDMEQCLRVCAELPTGTNDDLVENTVGCRIYHAHSALIAPENHCPHAGPGGAGHCGEIEDGFGNCESYCWLARAACEDEFEAEFGTGDDAEAECQAVCRELDGAADDPTTSINETEQYSVSLAESDDAKPFRCRLLHTARAFDDPSECAAALGDGCD